MVLSSLCLQIAIKMNAHLHRVINRYLVADTPILPWYERIRSAIGVALGVAAVFCVTLTVFEHQYAMLAAIGASAVIVFCIPQSPMAQPWSVIGAYLIAAGVALLIFQVAPQSLIGLGIVITIVVLIMMSAKCLHPPAGAVTIYVFNQNPVSFEGVVLVLASVLISAGSLLMAAIVINNYVLGRRYPQCQIEPVKNPHKTNDQLPTHRTGISHEDLDYALKKHGAFVDVQENELIDLYETAIDHAFSRKMNARCGDIMARDVVFIRPTATLDDAWRLLHQHKIKALPVIDHQRYIIGIITIADFLKDIAVRSKDPVPALEVLVLDTANDSRTVDQIMTTPVYTERVDTTVDELIRKLSDWGMHHVPIVDASQQLVGMVTQSDLIASMYQKIVLNSK